MVSTINPVYRCFDSHAIIFKRLWTTPAHWDNKKKRLVYTKLSRSLIPWITIHLILFLNILASSVVLGRVVFKGHEVPAIRVVFTVIAAITFVMLNIGEISFFFAAENLCPLFNAYLQFADRFLNDHGAMNEVGTPKLWKLLDKYFVKPMAVFSLPLTLAAAFMNSLPLQVFLKYGLDIEVTYAPYSLALSAFAFLITLPCMIQLFRMGILALLGCFMIIYVGNAELQVITSMSVAIFIRGISPLSYLRAYDVVVLVNQGFSMFVGITASVCLVAVVIYLVVCNFILVSFYGSMPFILYVMVLVFAGNVYAILELLLDPAATMNAGSIQCLHEWKKCLEYSRCRKYMTRKVKAHLPLRVYAGSGWYNFFYFRRETKVRLGQVVSDYTINALLSIDASSWMADILKSTALDSN